MYPKGRRIGWPLLWKISYELRDCVAAHLVGLSKGHDVPRVVIKIFTCGFWEHERFLGTPTSVIHLDRSPAVYTVLLLLCLPGMEFFCRGSLHIWIKLDFFSHQDKKSGPVLEFYPGSQLSSEIRFHEESHVCVERWRLLVTKWTWQTWAQSRWPWRTDLGKPTLHFSTFSVPKNIFQWNLEIFRSFSPGCEVVSQLPSQTWTQRVFWIIKHAKKGKGLADSFLKLSRKAYRQKNRQTNKTSDRDRQTKSVNSNKEYPLVQENNTPVETVLVTKVTKNQALQKFLKFDSSSNPRISLRQTSAASSVLP